MKKKGRVQFVATYQTLPREPTNPTYFRPHPLLFYQFVPDKENSDMILIIRRNISSNDFRINITYY